MRNLSRWTPWALVVVSTSACRPDDSSVVRGKGLSVASLSPTEQAHIYEAAVHGAFDVDESLSLVLDSRELPQSVGLDSSGRVPVAVAAELKRSGIVRGDCEPPLRGVPGVPHCAAERPGYIVRFSPVFTLRADSVQVYAYFQNYDIVGSASSQTLRFERAYQVVKHGEAWQAVREGHVPKELRGEPRG